jgi:hypothetical protein
MTQIKDKILELAEIAKSCPENLQTTCFETLLKDYLAKLAPPSAKGRKELPAGAHKSEEPKVENSGGKAENQEGARQEDLKASDLYLKVKKFMEGEGRCHYRSDQQFVLQRRRSYLAAFR